MGVVESRRKAELKAMIAPGDVLDLKSACALTELELIETQYEGYISTNDFECDGVAELEVNGKEAMVRGARFSKGGKRVEVIGCLKLGSGWSAQQVRGDEDCDAPPPETKKSKQPAKHGK